MFGQKQGLFCLQRIYNKGVFGVFKMLILLAIKENMSLFEVN